MCNRRCSLQLYDQLCSHDKEAHPLSSSEICPVPSWNWVSNLGQISYMRRENVDVPWFVDEQAPVPLGLNPGGHRCYTKWNWAHRVISKRSFSLELATADRLGTSPSRIFLYRLSSMHIEALLNLSRMVSIHDSAFL